MRLLVCILVTIFAVSLLFACSSAKTVSDILDPSNEVEVVRVIDGDTLDVTSGRVRLFGVDTPERGQRCAMEATERLRELAGDTVRLKDGPRLTDTYGRTLAYVYTVDGISIDAALIREGFATAWTRDGQLRDMLVGLEREARRQGAGGLW